MDSPVTLTVTQQPLADVLSNLLDPIQLGWYVVEPGHIVVTGRAKAKNRVEPRVYRIGRLLAAGQSGPKLIERITSSIEAETWTTTGGAGSAAHLPGLLVVVNNHRVQTQVEQMLEMLMNLPDR